VITHRTNIVSQLDRLMVMSGGAISHYGPRQQVLAELNAQAQKHATQAGASIASVATRKDDVDEQYDSQSSNR
jgi:ATP-binding cassette, subfamily C, bacterial EexD